MEPTCPLCSTEKVGEIYDERSPVWIIGHLLEQHLDASDTYHSQGILCVCGGEFRGPRSWAEHVLSLRGELLDTHVVLVSFGSKASYFQKPRRWNPKTVVQGIAEDKL